MAVDDTKRLGYGGSAEIDGVQVLVTSASFDTQYDLSYLEMLDITPTAGTSRARTKHADGTKGYSGSVSFDLTTTSLALFTTSKLLSRGYSFDVGIHDGESAEEMSDCYVTGLTLSGAAEGIVTASISFVAASAPTASLSVANTFIRDQEPLGYWYSGNTDVRDWTLSMNQDASPVYMNESGGTDARYIKYGLFDFSLEVTTYEAVVAHSSVSVATSTFTLTGDTTGEGFAFTGVTELGAYTHVFETAADITVGSGDTIIA
jgi:hypothetical protein